MLQVRKGVEHLEQVVVDAAAPHIEEFELRHLRNVLEERAGDLGAADIEVFQVFPVLEMGNAEIGDVFGIVQVEDLHIRQGGEAFEALVGDLGVGKIDRLQVREAGKLFQVGVGE